MIKLSLMTIGD